jgi:glycosyltransferase involved in cell wall biosynthesis
MPSLNYGNFRKPLLGWFTRISLRKATHISSPSETLIRCNYTFKTIGNMKQGFRNLASSVNTPCTVIHNGINTSHFVPVENVLRRKKSFLTICTSIDQRNYFLKGLDLYIEAARNFPECEFTIIGRLSGKFTIQKPDNVILADFIPNKLLPERISGFTYYCQFSMSEGFGVALAEAMACGCIPVVSNVGIMGYIAGDSGFILEKHDITLLKTVIQKALDCDTAVLSMKARNRIVGLFNNNKRASEFLELIGKLIKEY